MAKAAPRRMLVFLAAIAALFMEGALGTSSFFKDLEWEKHLKHLNRPSVKTIQSRDGDIIDCVDIHKQPAFDHPRLKNHKIQMRPTTFPREKGPKLSMASPRPTWQESGTCPGGTTTPTVAMRFAVVLAFSSSRDSNSVVETANALVYANEGAFYGAKAQINAWKIRVEPNEFSASKITLLSSDRPDASSIQVGWIVRFRLSHFQVPKGIFVAVKVNHHADQVHPLLFGDDKTRLFTYWTGDGFNKTGCFNLLCPGFVQVSQDIVLGADITPLSAYNGTQYVIDLLVYKDPNNGNWWLIYGNKHPVGYWPTSLFKNLKQANLIEWGGEVLNAAKDGAHTSTQMGSGHFPLEGLGKASYFRNILTVDRSNTFRAPVGLVPFSDRPQCYDIRYDGSKIGRDVGYFFFYGGPGGSSNCP
ncbi:hypothetical protein ACLOJK_040014 [Asimina triloba]